VTDAGGTTDRDLAAEVAELRRVNQDLQAFAARVSHDLRQPLAVVVGYLDLVGSRFGDSLPATARTAVTAATSSARRMLDTIDSLRGFTTAQAPVHRVAVDIGAVVAAARADLFGTPDAGGSASESTRDAGGDGWITVDEPLPTVTADPTVLRLVVANLLSNAVKFAEPQLRDPSIRVSAGTDGDGWWLRVADNGPGIPAAERDRVFEAFVRGSAAGDTPGDGIGLAAACRAAQALGGQLVVEPTPGGGATLLLRVPA
jgi:signal transduction histidine kinase